MLYINLSSDLRREIEAHADIRNLKAPDAFLFQREFSFTPGLANK